MSVFESLLNNTFTIFKPTRSSDGQGGWTVAYENVGTISGRISPESGRERVVADTEEQYITHTLYTMLTTTSTGETIGRGCLVYLDDLVVEILGIHDPSEAHHHYEIDCFERQDELVGELGS